MFNGIIEHVGTVIENNAENNVLVFRAPEVADTLSISDSIAVNGVCLTVIAKNNDEISADVMPETYQRTNLGALKSGDMLNLELPMMAESRVNGHFVYGHVDTTARLITVIADENANILSFSLSDTALLKYIVEKGSIAVNGISLTVINVTEAGFSVGIIPFTWLETNLSKLKLEDSVNIEVDMLAKHLEKLTISNSNYSQNNE